MSGVNNKSRWIFIAVSIVIGGLVLHGTLVATGVISQVRWVGTKQLPVRVLVLDRESLQPVRGVDVVLFDGPRSPLEGRISNYRKSEFSPAQDDEQRQQAKTSEDGLVVITRRFGAAGTDGPFTQSGYVDTSRVWVHVSTDGYASITLPLDGQSALARDIDDEYPVYVTLLLTKVKP